VRDVPCGRPTLRLLRQLVKVPPRGGQTSDSARKQSAFRHYPRPPVPVRGSLFPRACGAYRSRAAHVKSGRHRLVSPPARHAAASTSPEVPGRRRPTGLPLGTRIV
jgi:hypothetical protein